MSRIVKIFKAFRNHPKKTILFSALAAYGINYAKSKYEFLLMSGKEEQLLAAYCKEASWYGDQPLPYSANHRHITVLLNPAAAGGKCKAQFDKYCAPLLHLAGLKVAIVRTEHQGQARDLMAIMEKTDGVVLAGGDGTLSEALTGLLRRTDDAASRLPLSILPLGACSVAGKAVWGLSEQPQPRDLLEATMAVVREVLSPMDVMEVLPLTSADENPAKPIFACMLEWGAYRDAWERRDKYWYWATLRRYVTYLFSSYKDLNWDCSCSVLYTLPCAGCSRCAGPASSPQDVKEKNIGRSKRWYHYLLPSMGNVNLGHEKPDTSLPHTRPTEDRSGVINPECGEVHEETVGRVCDVRVATRNSPAASHLLPHQLLFRTGATDTSTTEFISEGWRRTSSGAATHAREQLVGSITIRPTGELKNNQVSFQSRYYF
ncbi:hypothetical protein HAZT_HAZT009231 [Hyalella azteca]|uniref:Acylglycerol kinase, mitochondrial n=1 Tax=Hyalella azteca TaxID=294128 RepID=A0A6A0H9K5_HYAAZ|nr:hypothetical protein HAZT_HAZT009231 [Hyalella azteca]